MKQTKKLKRYQKVKLSKKNLNPDDFRVKCEDAYTYTVISTKPDRNGNLKEYTFEK